MRRRLKPKATGGYGAIATLVVIVVVGVVAFLNRINERPAVNGELVIHDTHVAADTARKVTLGFYVNRIWDVDLTKGEFSADFYVWIKWRGDAKDAFRYEFMNEVSHTETEYSDDSNRFVNGQHFKGHRVLGRFHSNFDLKRFPFDEQVLSIVIEDSANNMDKMVYHVDAESKFAPEINIGDWVLTGYTAIHLPKVYQSSFGYPGDEGKTSPAYSQVSVNVHMKRLLFPYMFKTVLPLFIIALMAGLSFFVVGTDLGVRSGIGITALLTSIALHVSVNDSLPNVGYSTAMDRYFLLANLLILFSTLVSVVNVRVHPQNQTLAEKIDLISSFVFYIALVTGFLLIS